MPYEVYKMIHVLGIILLFLSLGAFLFPSVNRQTLDKKQKKPWLITHGVAMFLLLLGGFGLLARIGIKGEFPTWVWIKLIIWIALGGAVTLLLRKPAWSKISGILIVLLGVSAALMAIYKPFL